MKTLYTLVKKKPFQYQENGKEVIFTFESGISYSFTLNEISNILEHFKSCTSFELDNNISLKDGNGSDGLGTFINKEFGKSRKLASHLATYLVDKNLIGIVLPKQGCIKFYVH